jgi:ribokinase
MILIVGSINIDFTIKVKRFPEEGETITDGVFFQSPGGKGLNQAVASARAGEKTFLVCSVGNDVFWKFIEDYLKNEKNLTILPEVNKGFSTGVAFILVDDKGKNKIVVSPGANAKLSSNHVRQVLEQSNPRFVVLQCEIPFDVVQTVMEMKNKLNFIVVFNTAPFKSWVREIIHIPDFVIMNEVEAKQIFGKDVKDKDSAVVVLKDYPFHNSVMITLGKDGVVLLNQEKGKKISHFPAFEVDVVDTTGAGDTFAGYFSAMMSAGKDLEESINLAQAASAVCVTREGAVKSIPKFHEVLAFLQTLK